MFVIKLARPEEEEGTLQCYAFLHGGRHPASRKMSVLFNRETVLKVAAVSPARALKAQGHPCKAFQGLRSFAWREVGGLAIYLS